MRTKDQILQRMDLYSVEGGGIGSWLTQDTSDTVFERLGSIESDPLRAVQLNQLLVLAHEAPVSDGFFQYYWLDVPELHPYAVDALPNFTKSWKGATAIGSLDQLAWGLHRLYIDGLLYYGNVRTAFRALRDLSRLDLQEFFSAKRFDTDAIKRRGPPLPLRPIAKDKRYLISEMACKSYGDNPQITSDLRRALNAAYATHVASGKGPTTIGQLLHDHLPSDFHNHRERLVFSASEILGQSVASWSDVDDNYLRVASRFADARMDALENTKFYLSMLTDLDVYVATSMRTPDHFVKMAQTCEAIFSNRQLSEMNLRFFDPTLSAANGHEDKGLIECLMVKCAKALVYCGGDKESFGKDAEAAMALSLGRPVIFYCEKRHDFYRETHPLTRLIQFDTGVAVGAMVTDKIEDVIELLARTFENRMLYQLERTESGLRLKDALTASVVRIQTSDKLITETFWNHYHQDRNRRPIRTAAAPAPETSKEPAAKVIALPPRTQGKLLLEDTADLLPLAARRPSASRSEQSTPTRSNAPPAAKEDEFPLSLLEVFDAVSNVKSNQKAGIKRRAIFEQWVQTERVGVSEAIKVLRFANATLEANSARSAHVYGPADLTRWYQEMCNGDVVGSWR